MRDDGEMKTWKSMMIGVLIGFLAGVGTMQYTLVGDVREHATKIIQLNRDIETETASINDRIDRITKLMESILESNRQLVAELAATRRHNASQ